MTRSSFRTALVGFALLTGTSLPSAAQQRPVENPTPQVIVAQSQDARETREQLEELLKKLPPALGRVLRTDPSLLNNEAYLATYPVLAQFIKQHPEIRTAPGFYFEHIGPAEFWNPERADLHDTPAIRIWRDLFQFFAIGGMFVTVAAVLLWIIRTLVEHRRWLRTSKVHTEVHNKLMDRLTANEDLMAYMQSPAGRRFLESAPLSIETPARPVGAPLSRILWSIQTGVVLAAAGIGLLFVSTGTIEEVAQPISGLGVLALAIGAGFVVSAGASFLLSRRLGLVDSATPPREHAENAGQ
jgi:hypothetical protein